MLRLKTPQNNLHFYYFIITPQKGSRFPMKRRQRFSVRDSTLSDNYGVIRRGLTSVGFWCSGRDWGTAGFLASSRCGWTTIFPKSYDSLWGSFLRVWVLFLEYFRSFSV
ncbi:hypothetical protein IC582_015441 [Cucumis melo]